MAREDRFIAVDVEALPWIKAERPWTSGDDGLRFRTIFEGGPDLPNVHLTEYTPGWVEPRHRHAEDEVLLIVQGELIVDGNAHRAPSALFVGIGTLYGPLTAGPEGARFFRVAAKPLAVPPRAAQTA